MQALSPIEQSHAVVMENHPVNKAHPFYPTMMKLMIVLRVFLLFDFEDRIVLYISLLYIPAYTVYTIIRVKSISKLHNRYTFPRLDHIIFRDEAKLVPLGIRSIHGRQNSCWVLVGSEEDSTLSEIDISHLHPPSTYNDRSTQPDIRLLSLIHI